MFFLALLAAYSIVWLMLFVIVMPIADIKKEAPLLSATFYGLLSAILHSLILYIAHS